MHYFTPTTSLHDLKQQYRRLARTHHPDNGGSGEEMAAVNAEYARWLVELEQSDIPPPPPFFSPPHHQPPPPVEVPPNPKPRKPRLIIPTKEQAPNPAQQTPKHQQIYLQQQQQTESTARERIASGIQTIGKVGSYLYDQFKPEIHNVVRKTADKIGERLGEKLGEKFGETLGDSFAERFSEGITTLFPGKDKPEEPQQ
jgi:hypothetical protein